eukprot:scaffold129262_cov18-Prasinocladus_malaysianus.AAC.2
MSLIALVKKTVITGINCTRGIDGAALYICPHKSARARNVIDACKPRCPLRLVKQLRHYMPALTSQPEPGTIYWRLQTTMSLTASS